MLIIPEPLVSAEMEALKAADPLVSSESFP